MAVQLKDDGRYPASQQIPTQQFREIVETCKNPPAPSAGMVATLQAAAKHEVDCR